VPTGVALRDAPEQLLAAAERLLRTAGPTALTSRNVTAESGVAKGVLHRYFGDFDAFLAELVRRRIAGLPRPEPGGSVVPTVAAALTEVFDPVNLGLTTLVLSRDALRDRLREATPHGIPLLTEAAAALADYLRAEPVHGDVDTLAMTLVGAGHLLFAGEPGAPPDASAVHEVVESVLLSAIPGT